MPTASPAAAAAAATAAAAAAVPVAGRPLLPAGAQRPPPTSQYSKSALSQPSRAARASILGPDNWSNHAVNAQTNRRSHNGAVSSACSHML